MIKSHISNVYLQVIIIVSTLLCISCQESSVCVKANPPFNPLTSRIYYSSRQLSYKELVTLSDYFFDKTQFIVDVLHQRKFTYIFSHKHSGKSTLMDMLRTYLQKEVHPDGGVTPWKDSWAAQFFLHGKINSNSHLRSPPKVSQFEPENEKYLAKQFAILLDFSEVSADDCCYPTLLTLFKNTVLLKAFQDHDYVIPLLQKIVNNANATVVDKQNATFVLKGIEQIKSMPDEDVLYHQPLLKEGVRLLTRAFNLTFGQKTYILMDNFHHPLAHIYYYNLTSTKELDASRRFLRSVFEQTAKHNELVAQAIIMDIYELEWFMIRKEKTLHMDTITNFLAEYFYVNQAQADELLQLKQLQHLSDDVKLWYGGYYVGTKNESSYNIYALSTFLNERKIQRYWTRLESSKIFLQVFKFNLIRWDFQNVLCNGEVPMPDECEYLPEDFSMMGRILMAEQPFTISPFEVKFTFNHVFVEGYLSKYFAPVVRFRIPYEQTLLFLNIPNFEIRSVMIEQLLEYYEEALNINFIETTPPVINTLIEFLHDKSNSTTALETEFQQLYRKTSVLFDNRKNKKSFDTFTRCGNTEAFHTMVFLLLMKLNLLHPRYTIMHEYSFTELQERHGYCYMPDLMLYDEPNKEAVTIEVLHHIVQPLPSNENKEERPIEPRVSKERYFSRFLKYRNISEIVIKPLELHINENFHDPFNLNVKLIPKTNLYTDSQFYNRTTIAYR